jgi:hypothetical protein
VAAWSKAWTVFTRLSAGIVGSNLTWGMDDCVRLFCVCGLILRPRDPNLSVKDEETEKAAKAQKRAVEP